LSRYTHWEKTIQENLDYQLNNFEAITITQREKASLNGGCTEPHVSHPLSDRLSSRTMEWSKATLMRFVPILAAGSAAFSGSAEQEECDYPSTSAFLKEQKKLFRLGTLGLADPDNAVMFLARHQ